MHTLSDSLSTLLRNPSELARDLVEGRRLPLHARAALLAIALGGAAFGAVVGSHRGGLQLAYAAIKLPATLLISLALTVPAIYGLSAAFDRRLPLGRISAAILASTARSALVLLAFAPAVALGIGLDFDYHDVALASTVAFGLAAVAGYVVLHRVLQGERTSLLALLLCISVQAIVTTQTAWVLRPWIVRPSSSVVFVRAPDGTAVESVTRTAESAAGVYDSHRSAERARERAHQSGESR